MCHRAGEAVQGKQRAGGSDHNSIQSRGEGPNLSNLIASSEEQISVAPDTLSLRSEPQDPSASCSAARSRGHASVARHLGI